MSVTATRRGRALIAVLAACSAFAPIALDVYLPSLPSLISDLGASDAQGQLTVSACMIGLALGQLFIGPISDRVGRRMPLLSGIAVFVAASAACAFAPSMEVLLGLRFVQGLAGAAGLVVSRAIVRDVYPDREIARVFSLLAVVSGIAPVVAPAIGGALEFVTDWRGVFAALAVLGGVIFIVVVLVVPESLPQVERHVGGSGSQLRDIRRVLQNRRFVGFVVTNAILGATFFVYIAMSSVTLQRDFGLSPQLFAAVYVCNAVGLVIGSQTNAILVRRVAVERLLLWAAIVSAAATALGMIFIATGLPVLFLVAAIFVTAAAQGTTWPNLTALALTSVSRSAGTASALLGVAQYVVAALLPPLVSIGGANAFVMLATMFGCSAVGLVLVVVLLSRGTPPPTPAVER